MKPFQVFTALILPVLCCLGGGPVFAGDTATIGVQAQISEIDEISVGAIAPLVITTASAGSQPNAVSEAFTYSITSNQTDRAITGHFDETLPPGVTITLELSAPSGSGASCGPVTFTGADGAEAQTLVTGVGPVAEIGIVGTLTFAATVQAGAMEATGRTFTLTITAP